MQSLELSGIAMDNDGNPMILKLSRTVPDQEKRELYHVGKTNLPTPPPSRLPTDGTVALRLELTETLSRNTRNTVYGVRVLNADAELESGRVVFGLGGGDFGSARGRHCRG